MIYNNLLFFLIAIFLFSMAPLPDSTLLPFWLAVPLFITLFYVFDKIAHNSFHRLTTSQTSAYFRAEKRISIAALMFFTVFIFGLNLKNYLAFLSFGDTFPALVNIGGLAVFLLLLIIIWRRAKTSYETIFARQYSTSTFIFSNIKANLPIVIPWVVLTICYDLINLLQWPWLKDLVNTEWGDMLFFGAFIFFALLFFPPLVRKLWGCKELSDGPLKEHLTAFCLRQNFSAKIYLWPLFEGRVITAGVMGIVPGFRYLLITPALIETMTLDELDSVMAHEIGHVKRFHLLLYLFLIGGFVVSFSLLAEPLYHLFFAGDLFYSVVGYFGWSPDMMRNIAITVPALLIFLFFFRFVFGYFIRNFERQADLHVFPVLGNSTAIISAFEKIALLSGKIRDQPSWHHFGIGERVDYLEKCEQDPAWISNHHKKVKLSLVLYVVLLAAALFSVRQFPAEDVMTLAETKFDRADLLYKADQEKNPAHWLLFAGNYLAEHKLEARAVLAYQLAMEKEPNQPEILNNYAWLLLTSRNMKVRDPGKALELSRLAAILQPQGHILDTLATAWWANGFVDEAIETARKALLLDPEQSAYYQSQIERFRKLTYAEETQGKLLFNRPLPQSSGREEKS